MYRSNRKEDEMPSPRVAEIPSFVQLPETPSVNSSSSSVLAQQTFFERIQGLPLFREAVNRVQNVYQHTKERNGLLRGALERGESTVTYSLTRAADVLNKTGLQKRLEKPLSLADSSACFVLDKVESKLPIITKSTYEIKLMISDNVESKMDQLTAVKDNTVRLYDDYKSKGTQTFVDAKQIGVEKVQAVLETPYGQKLSQTVEQGLTMADSVVDRFLPEAGHSHKNGNGISNGVHYTHTNGTYTGTLDHAKSLSRKVKRRLSAKSHDVVDSLRLNPAIFTVTEVAKKNFETGRSIVQEIATGVYFKTTLLIAKLVDTSYATVMFFLPKPIQTKLVVLLDGVMEKMSSGRSRSTGLHQD